MDELARRYLLLCLRLGRLVPGFVDSYVGPAHLAEAADSEPMPLPSELHDEAMLLRTMAADLVDVQRQRWLDGQLRAIAVLARRAGGEEIAYVDLVEQLYGVPIAPTPEAELLAARDRLDGALPGASSLAERLSAFRRQHAVLADRVLPGIVGSAQRFRQATLRDFALPDGEGIDWEEVHDQPWGAHAGYLGKGRTRVRINVDLPLDVVGAAYLAYHEGYPGHHAEHVAKEHSLVQAGVGEAAMRTMNTPEAMLAEGQADIGREVVMTDGELEAELGHVGRDVGVDGDWPAAVAVERALRELVAVQGNAALMLHHDGRPESEVRDWIQEVSPRQPERLDHLLRSLKDPVLRTYPFTYIEGARLISRWLEVVGQTAGFDRLLREQLSPAQLQVEAEAALLSG